VHTVSDFRQIEIHRAESLVPGPSPELEIAIAKLKKCKSPGSDQIPAVKEVKHYCLRSINSLILCGVMKNCLISGRSLLFYQFIKKVTKLGYHCYKLHTKFY
jgi:hypothetical protein